MAGRIKASVTVPFCLVLVILGALILGLVEAARFYGLKEDASEWTNLATESLFAGYQPYLLEEYEMFFLDGGFGSGEWKLTAAEDEMEALLYDNLMASEEADGLNVYRMQVSDVEVIKYRLATDEAGEVFEMQAANAMKDVIGKRAAQRILQEIENVSSKEEEAGDPEEAITNANTTLEELAKQAEQEADNVDASKGSLGVKVSESYKGAEGEAPAVENPLEVIKTVRSQGILTLVLPSGQSVSGKTMSVDNCLLNRDCVEGNYAQQEEPGWYERILMQEFIKPLAGNFRAPNEEGVLSYGVEYLICGKDSDMENLKSTVNKLLLLRETVNFLYLQQDETKKAEALTIATAVAGASANPAIVEIVKQGILAAWAYAESICDVKALLAGGKVPLIKNSNNWQTQLSNIGEAATKNYEGEESGLSYENYLDALLYAKSVKQVAYRSMDLMEQGMQKETGCENCRMDHMIVGLKMKAAYDADPLFFGILGEDSTFAYQFEEDAEYVYHK